MNSQAGLGRGMMKVRLLPIAPLLLRMRSCKWQRQCQNVHSIGVCTHGRKSFPGILSIVDQVIHTMARMPQGSELDINNITLRLALDINGVNFSICMPQRVASRSP